MAALAFGGAERRLAVVADAAIFVLVYVIHLYARAASFVFENGRVTITAPEH